MLVKISADTYSWGSVFHLKHSYIKLVNVYVDLVVFTRIAGTS